MLEEKKQENITDTDSESHCGNCFGIPADEEYWANSKMEIEND